MIGLTRALPFLLAASSAMASSTSIPLDVRLRAGFVVPEPSGIEATLLEDANDGRLDRIDALTGALVASGVADVDVPTRRARALSAIEPARAEARAQPTAKARGDRLLRALHGSVLRRYRESQSRVDRIIESGEFNCLSSAVLFVVAAEGIVDAPRGMISRTHAFARVTIDGKPADVETTTPAGFAVDRARLVTPAYLRTLGVGDGLTDAERLADLKNPEEVPVTGLLAALYGNRGVMLIREGDVEGAAVAFDRATRLARGDQRVRFAEWRAALLNNAVRGLMDEGRLDDARVLLALALQGTPAGATRDALQTNLASVALAQAERARAAGRLAEARAYLDDALQTGAMSPDVRRSVEAVSADVDGRLAAETGDEARCRSLTTPIEQGRCLASAARAHLAAGRGARALPLAQEAAARAPGEAGVVATLYNALATAVRAADADGDCARVETLARDVVVAAAQGKGSPPFVAARVVGACWWGLADKAADRGDLEQAMALYGRALVHRPDQAALRRNLIEISLRRATGFARDGRCDEARPLAVRAIREGDARGLRLLEGCANERALAAAAKQDWAAAVVELRRGLIDAPGSEVLQENLGAMLHNLAVTHLRGERCAEAVALVPDLRAVGRDAIVADIERVCSHAVAR